MKATNRIGFQAKLRAAHLVRVRITRRDRSKNGFILVAPDGTLLQYRTKIEAVTALLCKLRCEEIRKWDIVTAQNKLSYKKVLADKRWQ